MHIITNAAFCANYDNYDFLLDVAHSVTAARTGIELSIYSDKPEFMKNQQDQKARFADVPITFHGPFTDVEAASAPGTADRQRFIDAYKYAFDVYEEFSGQSMVLHTHKMRDIPEFGKERMRGWALENINTVGEIALSRGIRLTVENVGHWVKNNVLFNEEQFIAMFDQLPKGIGCLIDVGHALINRWDIFHVVHTLNTRVFSYHLHNNNGCADSHRPMFEAGGRYTAEEMKELLRVIHRCSPDADLILEYHPGEHITKKLLTDDLTVLAKIAAE